MKKIFYVILGCLGCSACDKLEVEDVNFGVKTNQITVKAEEPVEFIFSGNPDNITFFSGEIGSKYEHRNRTKVEGEPEVQFTSYRQYGTQENTLQLMASTDFNGVTNADIEKNGTWIDISDRATFSTGSDNTPSGVINLKDFLKDKPLYLAFKFVGSSSSTQRTWTIKNFLVRNVVDEGLVLPITDITEAGWVPVSVKNPDKVWTNSPLTQLRIAGGPANTDDNEDWMVTKALDLSSVKPDAGVALKNLTVRMDSYSHVYTKPGTYTATFVASNTTVDGAKTVVREVKVVVQPK